MFAWSWKTAGLVYAAVAVTVFVFAELQSRVDEQSATPPGLSRASRLLDGSADVTNLTRRLSIVRLAADYSFPPSAR